ncbi:hypothetical protein [Actinokineospora pegani]|uniref:hypothetical protein n=1 Tax=Actinokineospora pegani TaxID=2654637 RepID=UPI0012EAD308|nr:hypothetical protein [Actinokineospora pegani]
MRNGIRRLVCSSLAVAAVSAAALAGAGPAAADPANPLPFLALSCEQDVVAFRGQPIILARLAVNGMVTKAVSDTEGLGPLAAVAVGVVFPLGIGVEVGEVPDGEGAVSPQAVADAVVAAVRPMREIEEQADTVVAKVREQVEASCGMAVRALNPTPPPETTEPAPPSQAPDEPTATPPGTPTGSATRLPAPSLYPPTSAPGSGATAPPRDYSGIPYAPAGVYTPSSPEAQVGVPGYTPQFGIIGQDENGVDVQRAAGNAQVLPADHPRTGGVGAPLLLAALVLSVVTGSLVRTWVLRQS